MNDSEDHSSSSSDATPGNSGGRKPYEKPQVIYRAPLEAMAAVCAPSPPAKGNPGVCPTGPISS